MPQSIHEAFFWLGVIVFTLAAIPTLLNVGMRLIDKIVYQLGIYERFIEVAKKMHKENDNGAH